MIDTDHLKLDPRTAVRAVVWRFGVPLARMSIFLPLPVALHAFSQGMKLATTVFGEQKPQQNQDDEFMGQLDIQEKHRFLRSY